MLWECTRAMQCNICGGEAYLVHRGTRDNPHVDVYECQQCHTKQLNRIVDNDYENGFMNTKCEMSPEEISSRLNICKVDDLRRAKSLSSWCVQKDVLDFGCGFGGFLSEISCIAKKAVGVELGAIERKYLKSRGLRVEKEIESYKDKFDVITLFHVFEHLSTPRIWLYKFSNFLRGGGKLFLEVPNGNDALLSLYESREFSDFTYWSAHLYLYTKESLVSLIEENGNYEIEDAGQIQRYPLSNHLYWLAKGKPGGHEKWHFLDSDALNSAYTQVLAVQNYCDTLFFRLRRK